MVVITLAVICGPTVVTTSGPLLLELYWNAGNMPVKKGARSMSQANLVYSQTATGGLSLCHDAARLYRVREDEGEYNPDARAKSLELSRLSGTIHDKLIKAEAVASLMSDYTLDDTITEASNLLVELIEEIRTVHNELWGKLTERK